MRRLRGRDATRARRDHDRAAAQRGGGGARLHHSTFVLVLGALLSTVTRGQAARSLRPSTSPDSTAMLFAPSFNATVDENSPLASAATRTPLMLTTAPGVVAPYTVVVFARCVIGRAAPSFRNSDAGIA